MTTSRWTSPRSDIVDTAQRTGATITGPVPLPTEKNVYCVIRSPVQGQGLAGALRDPDAQAADRHPLADPEDGRLAHAARPPGRRRHRDQAVAMKGIVGKKARDDAALRRGERRRDVGHGDRGGPVPGRRRAHARRRRLRGRAARVRAGRRPQALEGRARPPRQERRRRRVPPPDRVPRALLGRGAGRERDGRDLRSPATRSRSRASASARASRARSSATTSTAAPSRTARTTSASRARSARPRRRRASSRA